MLQDEKAQLQLDFDAVAAQLANRGQEMAAARTKLKDVFTTIEALESQAGHLDSLLCYYKQQLLTAMQEAKVCMPALHWSGVACNT